MKRLYEDYAYGPEPIKNCFWDRSVPLPQLPPLSGSRKVDVAVIGAGYTGLSAALHLAQDGAEVAVVDAETAFWGASGRNGGFCCLGGAKASDKTLVTRFGNAGKTAFRCAGAGVSRTRAQMPAKVTTPQIGQAFRIHVWIH